jgi:hypothetical protein
MDANADAISDGDRGQDAAQDSPPTCNGADPTRDPHNCGLCGHDCLGGQCVAGGCQPVTILSKESHPIDVGVDDSTTPPTVFFLDVGSAAASSGPWADGEVVRVAADGTGRMALARAKGSVRVGQPACLVLGAATVYFTNQLTGAVLLVPKEGVDAGPIQTLRNPVPMSPALGLAIDENPTAARAFWTEATTHDLVKTSLPPASPPSEQILFTASDVPWAIAIDGKTAFVQVRAAEQLVSAPRLGCASVDGGCPTELAKGSDLGWGCKAIALDKDYVYFKDGSSVSGGIFRVAKDGGAPPTELLPTQPGPAHIVVANGFVYWTAEVAAGYVSRYHISSRVLETLSSNQPYPRGIAVDSQAVYWVNQGSIKAPATFDETSLLNAFDNADGTVMKVALPP